MLSGDEELPGIRRNWENIYNNAFKLWAGADGGAIPIQSQDWWYYNGFSLLNLHTLFRLWFDDPYAAYLEHRLIDTLETTQAGHERGTFIDKDPDSCVVSSDCQTMRDMEPSVCHYTLYSYLHHLCFGEGVKPATKEEFEEHTNRVHHYPFGGSVVHRTPHAFSAFSYRNNALAFTLPEDKLWTITTPPASGFGVMQFKDGCPDNPGWSNQDIICHTDNLRVYKDIDTFSASMTIDRGLGRVRQDVSFVTLPDGTAVYFRRVKALKACEIRSFTSGLVGVRNEYFQYLPDCAKGYRFLFINDEKGEKMEGYIGGEDVLHDYSGVKYAAIDDKIAYLLHGSNAVRYVSHHNYPKWKGVEDYLVLDYYENLQLNEGDQLPLFTAVHLPNRDITEAKNLYGQFSVSISGTADAVRVGDMLIYSSLQETAGEIEVKFTYTEGEIPLFMGHTSFKDGIYTWKKSVPVRGCGYLQAVTTIPSDRYFDAVVLSDESVLIRYENEVNYHIL